MGKAILLTPPGGAAIAVVRLVGAGVGDFLRAHFDRPVREGRCVHGNLVDGARVLDDPVVVVSAGGRVADVSLHGGPWVVRSVLGLARRAGFEIVEAVGLPLEESAVDGGGELGREVLRWLPMAQTELAVRTLLGQEGAWERFKGASPSPEEVGAVLGDGSLQWLLRPPRVAVVGLANVGKSTLANQLFGRERSITADVPGTTRDWVGEVANVDGLAVVLVDTPGVRETGDAVEAEAIGRAREEVGRADLVVVVTDASRASEEERELVRAFPGAVYVANKADLAGAAVGEGWIKTVGTTGRGVDELRRVIRERFLGVGEFDARRARWWTERQRAILERAKRDAGALSEI